MSWGFHFYIGFKLWSSSWSLCEILKFWGGVIRESGSDNIDTRRNVCFFEVGFYLQCCFNCLEQ